MLLRIWKVDANGTQERLRAGISHDGSIVHLNIQQNHVLFFTLRSRGNKNQEQFPSATCLEIGIFPGQNAPCRF